MAALSLPVFWWRQAPPAGSGLQSIGLARDVAKGQKLVFGDLTLFPMEAGALSENYLERVAGAYAKTGLSKGALLRVSDLEWAPRLPAKIPTGKLAYPVAVETAIPLTEGDRIELWVEEGATLGNLSGVAVIDSRIPQQPILALSSEEIGWVEKARQRGKLRVAVRSEGDEAPTLLKKGTSALRKRLPSIQIWESD